MLHIAPEEIFEFKFRRIVGLNYLTADLIDTNAMVKMDITDIPYPDDSFDVIYCSHVLEHVPDDRRAMCELNRVLKPGRWAALHIPPLIAEPTVEDPRITNPEERERVFGQKDHLRRYGTDFKARLELAGFSVKFFSAAETLDANSLLLRGIPPWEGLFFCTKK